MPSRVRGIERLLGGKARSFFELDFICAVCKRQVDWNRAAVRRAVIAAANGIGLAHAPDLRPRVFFGDIRAAAPFCRTTWGRIDPTTFAGRTAGWYKDSTALATGVTAADDTARNAHRSVRQSVSAKNRLKIRFFIGSSCVKKVRFSIVSPVKSGRGFTVLPG